MSLKKLSPNAHCPCGTGKKYKACCFNKGFHYLEDENGNITRSVPLDPELANMLMEEEHTFIEKNGRPPNRDDRIFDNGELPDPAMLKATVVEAMKKVGIAPRHIYAFQKTGLLLSEKNIHLMPTKDVQEYEAAVKEYLDMHPSEGGLDS